MVASYTEVGRILKTHGYTGELRFHVEEPFLEDVARSEVLFIGNPDKPLPYFIEYIKWNTVPPIIKFEDLDNREKAKAILSQSCYLPDREVSVDSDQVESDMEFEFLTGYELLTQEEDVVGIIREVLQYPQQEMAVLEYEGTEKLIPLNETLILVVKKDRKQVVVDLPEGLLSL